MFSSCAVLLFCLLLLLTCKPGLEQHNSTVPSLKTLHLKNGQKETPQLCFKSLKCLRFSSSGLTAQNPDTLLKKSCFTLRKNINIKILYTMNTFAQKGVCPCRYATHVKCSVFFRKSNQCYNLCPVQS